MIPVSTKYRQQIIKDNRNYLIKADVRLADNTAFELKNEDIWEQGVVFDDASSSNDSFDIGAAIVNELKIVIDNITGKYDLYDFTNGRLVLWMGLEGDLNENDEQIYYRKGFYVVDDPSYNGSLITLNCLDNMTWFDVPYSGVNFPTSSNTTAVQLASAICNYIGVTLGTTEFPNGTHTLTIYKESLQELAKTNVNCREVIQYIAQKCCCYAKINTAGQLAFKWYNKYDIINLTDYDGGTYNTTTTPYSDGAELDGGGFMYGGDEADGGTFEQLQNTAWLSKNFEMNVSTDDIVVTGIRLRSTNGDEDTHYDETYVNSAIEQTHDRYVLIIENNPLILKREVSNIANIIGNILAGLPIRGFNARSLNDFSYEVGDMVTISDFRGNIYHTWITNLTFTTNNSESFSCGVESVKKRNETRFSIAAKTLAEAQQYAEEKLTDYDRAVKAMDELAQAAIGYNEYVQTVSGANIMYRYNGTTHTTTTPPKFPGSTVVFKITGDGIFIAKGTDIDSDGTCHFSNGYDANSGTAILNLIYVQGLNAKWITAGTIDAERIKATVISAINNSTGSTVIDGGKLSISGIVNGINNGTTTINGGKITTGTISATQIAANAVTAAKINAGAVTAEKISASAVTSDKIAANAVTAAKINVNNLKAISVNVGPWTIDDDGFTDGHDAWVQPNAIACGKHGATLVKMRGRSSGHDGYLSVEVNDYDDYVRVFYNSIERSDGKYAYFTDASDERLKKEIKELSVDEARLIVDNVEPVSFRYKAHDEIKHYGFIAQRIEKECKKQGLENPFVRNGELKDEMKMVDYIQYIAPMVKVIQHQQSEIDQIEQQLIELKERAV